VHGGVGITHELGLQLVKRIALDESS